MNVFPWLGVIAVPSGTVTSLRLTFSDDKPVAPVLGSVEETNDADLGYIVASWRVCYSS